MSKQGFAEFIKKLEQDSGLQSELKQRFADPHAGMPAADLAAFAADKGYRFAVEDISSELDDEALAAVAGGLTLNTSLSTTSFSLYQSPLSSSSLYIKFDSLAFKY